MIVRGMAYPDSGITYFTNNATYDGVKNYYEEIEMCKMVRPKDLCRSICGKSA